MKSFLSIFFILIINFYSCQNKYSFWELDQFNLNENALNDNQVVSIIYYCEGPYDNQVEQGFYRHAIVINNDSKDTINVLTFPNPELKYSTSNSNLFVYNNRPNLNKELANFEDLPDDINNMMKKIDSTKVSWEKFSKVVRDPDYDYIANNKYKTVIGSLTSISN
jgi:hypothetical protein